MRKVLTTLLLLLCLNTAVRAQIQLGLRGGANLMDLDLRNIQGTFDKTNRSGFYVGPTLKITIPATGLGFDLSALYDERTAWVDDVTTKEKSFCIPFNIRYGVGLGNMCNIFVFAGPQFLFNASSDSKTIISKSTYSEWTWESSALSVNAGLGFTLLKHIEVRGNYNIAIGKTGEATFHNTVEQAYDKSFESHYNAWQVGLTYYF